MGYAYSSTERKVSSDCARFVEATMNILELMSPTDTLEETRAKMQEYIENIVKLGWLINPKARAVEIYRLDKTVEVLDNPTDLSGENVLPGFVLDLQVVWG